METCLYADALPASQDKRRVVKFFGEHVHFPRFPLDGRVQQDCLAGIVDVGHPGMELCACRAVFTDDQ